MSAFGEISEPSTRTAWEDWDDVELTETFPVIRFQNNMDPPAEIATLLILEGRYLYDFIRVQHELEHINSAAEFNLHLYKTKEVNNYICVIKDYNLVLSTDILELIKDYITKSTDVITVVTKPLVEYQVAQLVGKDYIIRSLLTSKQVPRELNSTIPRLEQPNIIAGVSAGALCLREIMDKPAVALVCYIEHPEEQDIDELHDLLKKFKVIPDVAKIKHNNILNSNLYI